MTEWRNAVLIRYLSWKYLKQNLLLLDFCKVTPIEPRKRVVRVVGPNFELPGFGATFNARKCYLWPFSPTFSAPNFIKTHYLLQNVNFYHSQKFWENWRCPTYKQMAIFGQTNQLITLLVQLKPPRKNNETAKVR